MVEKFEEKKRTATPFFNFFLMSDEIDNQTVFCSKKELLKNNNEVIANNSATIKR